jgi:hypothetical protein
MRFFYEIELFKIVGRNKIKSFGLGHICYLFVGLKILGCSSIGEVLQNFFKKKNIEIIYLFL